MNNTFRSALIWSLSAVFLAFTGCTKITDILSDHPQATVSCCKIAQIIQPGIYENSDTIVYNYSYNTVGDPISIISNFNQTGNPDRFFRYDAQGRLTDYIGEYSSGNPSFEFWHKYVYDSANVVVRDTVYFWGNKGAQPTSYYDYAVVTYDYDSLGRISHTQQIWASYPWSGLDKYYTYDINGNIQYPGAVYDNKISAHRTNRVWMFLDRNYSVNNPNASGWNTFGLPTKELLDFNGGGALGTVEGSTEVTIVYDCGASVPIASRQ
jgi:hypothetical protein